MKPTIGRIVHFVPPTDAGWQSQHMAAIITYVHGDTMVNLCVFDPDGLAIGMSSVEEERGGTAPRSWHWPER